MNIHLNAGFAVRGFNPNHNDDCPDNLVPMKSSQLWLKPFAAAQNERHEEFCRLLCYRTPKCRVRDLNSMRRASSTEP